MGDVVEATREDGVAILTVNRPEALNAMNAAVVARLHDAVAAFSIDPQVRCIVLAGAGARSFVAGADITQFVDATPAAALALAATTKAMHDALRACPKPILAAINGFCLGAGLELALACDIRIASLNARFGLPEIKLGIIPGGGGTARLARCVGPGIARALAMTGETFDAARALALGLVSAVHPADVLPAAALAMARQLAGYSPFALAQLKSICDMAPDVGLESACLAEMQAFALCFSTSDQKEGARAFLEKRTPVFSGN
jgi:enoyl-CoA hydratase